MWKYLKGVPPPKKRKADDEGVSDTKAKMKKYDSSPRMRTFQLSWIHGRPWIDTIKLPARCIVMCASNSE